MSDIAKQPPIGIAGLACLATVAIIHYATEPLLSHLLVWWGRLLIYLAAPIAAAFAILFQSSWRRDLPRAKRILIVGVWSCIIFIGLVFAVGLALFILLLFVSGPPSTSHIPNEFGFERFHW